MKLLLDLGNSRLKWALHDRSPGCLAHRALDWQEDIAGELAEAWAGLPRPEMVVGASVVDGARESRLAEITQQIFACTPHWLRTPASACGVRNAYAEPRRLGVDRFLAMVAAHAAYRTPCVLVSAGTALALDALGADGQHLGGLIAPGVRLMQQSLLESTALVRPQRPGDILELADNTADAVTSGCWQAAAALVERFHAHMQPRLGATPTLILGGGDAQQLASMLPVSTVLVRDGVLHGLALWADTHLTSPTTIQERGP
ncbi:MAG: type III pantothenate kinase [Rhodanobacter sp.]|nr:MAG: type III pantothenate kinase [Rhodanobacter sp.]TAM41780.1 MAG: type III pantothenate kinase [Rhodanobacter sp.]TAN25864.1 MAG: type III pantothenate kinase [Rhodanobacter sp.]